MLFRIILTALALAAVLYVKLGFDIDTWVAETAHQTKDAAP